MKKIKNIIILLLVGLISVFLFSCKKKNKQYDKIYTDPSISVKEIYRSLKETPLEITNRSLSRAQIANKDNFLLYIPYEKINNYEELKEHFKNNFLKINYNDTLLTAEFTEDGDKLYLENIDSTFTKFTIDLTNLKKEAIKSLTNILADENRLVNTIYSEKIALPCEIFDTTLGEKAITSPAVFVEFYLFFVKEDRLAKEKQDPNSDWAAEIINYNINLTKKTIGEKSSYSVSYDIKQEGKGNPVHFAVKTGTPIEEYKYKFFSISDNGLSLDNEEKLKEAESKGNLTILPTYIRENPSDSNSKILRTELDVSYRSKYGTDEHPLRKNEKFVIKHLDNFTKPRLKYNNYFSIIEGVVSTALIDVGTLSVNQALENFANNVEFLDELNGIVYYDEAKGKKTDSPLFTKIKEQVEKDKINYFETLPEGYEELFKGSSFENIISQKKKEGNKIPKIYYLEDIIVENRDENNTEKLTFNLYLMVNDDRAPERISKANLYAKTNVPMDFINDKVIRDSCIQFLDRVTKTEDIKLRFDLVLKEEKREVKKQDRVIVTYEVVDKKENITIDDIPWHKNGEYKILVYATDEANNMTGSNMFKIIISGKSDVVSLIILINAVFILAAEAILIPMYIANKKRRDKDEK